MPYQSPLHILDSLNIEPDELVVEDINRLRKKILAEFSLSTDISIKLNDKSYTKDEVLKIIDQLKEVDNLSLQKEIFKRKPILDWLENPTRFIFPADSLNELLQDYPSNDFLQNTIQEAALEYVKLNFRKRLFEKHEAVFDLLNTFDEKYSYAVYDYLYLEIIQIIEDIDEAISSPNLRTNKEAFDFITSPTWTDFLNNLPAYFEEIRNKYCHSVIGYTVAIQRKDKEWTYEISTQLNQTICDESLQEVISKNHQIYSDNYHNTHHDNETNKSYNWVYWVIVILVNIVRMSSCSDHSSSSSSSYNPPSQTFQVPSSYEEKQQDTKIKIPANSYYILQIQEYQKLLFKHELKKGEEIENLINGQDLVWNLNIGNLEEYTDTQEKNNPQMVSIKNETDYDLIIFKAGCIANRSYFVHHNNNFYLECCEGDVLFFYFGKKWKRVAPIANKQEFDEKMRFQGYFAKTHNNSLATFMKQYTITSNNANSSILFNNDKLDRGVFPEVKNIELRENDSSILFQ
ncbi:MULTISPECIES: hypothetical protein [unclassified Arcicella]|uniref:hypothetical protein n=1 Tax=unclassified Arcicella TaxID=2644986 RepID=UPI002865CEE6|nr:MULTISPECIES: hypothetical protein [unclassified Arcicella]MDR6562756.1 hypothetical protein [Arcicella sp. BE51]MDR6812899.1 hypothetical protein [Arcicella sp. BE140]MDR6824213.1 hypothetical protein [Arcicella sp. BE139]